MSLLHHLTSIIKEPPADLVFEVSEGGIASARRLHGAAQPPSFQPFSSPVLAVSPLKDNVLQPETIAAQVRAILPPNGQKKMKTHRAIIVLPDYCARIAVMDFDQFPSDPAEQTNLVRFRMKRSVPFDVESAALSYYPQKPAGNSKKVDVVVVLVALEILARYEEPFRSSGVHPGYVTTSSLASLDLLTPEQTRNVSVMAKLSGRVLTTMVLDGARVKLVRCVELDRADAEEMMAVIYPTLAYAEDELGSRPAALRLCGFGAATEDLVNRWNVELEMAVEPLTSRFGAPGPFNAGLLGALEKME